MANTFKRYTANALGDTLTTIYTVPANTTTVVIGGVASNTTGSSANLEVAVNDGSNDINVIGSDTPIPSGTALSWVDGKIVLQAGDVLKAKGSTAGSIDMLVSIMEIG